MGETARDQAFELPVPWTDCWGVEHKTTTGRPVAIPRDARLGRPLQRLPDHPLARGADDAARHHRPSRRVPAQGALPARDPAVGEACEQARRREARTRRSPPRRWAGPPRPTTSSSRTDGTPVRIDKGFSWEYPLAVHGLMHSVITNAWRGDPYRIDTLMIFMANMAWNSTMNTGEVRRMLNDRDAGGEYKIPFIVVCDAFQSEMTAFADLVLPDTTYLERHDVMSILDRPISEFDGPTDSVRVPVVPPKGECRPFQEVLVELAGA
jgi:anaerobic selenocysteine-containing dehydrogenase